MTHMRPLIPTHDYHYAPEHPLVAEITRIRESADLHALTMVIREHKRIRERRKFHGYFVIINYYRSRIERT